VDSSPQKLKLEARRTLERVAAEDEDCPEVSTRIRDTILSNGSKAEIQEALAAEPFEVNTMDSLGYAPIHWAASRGSLDACLLLIQAGASMELRTRVSHLTPLQLAILRKHPRIVSLLLENGANPDAKNDHGCPPLHFRPTVEVLRILLAAGAKPNTTCGWCGFSTIHHYAVNLRRIQGHDDTATAISELAAAGADIDLQDEAGWTPILLAAETGNVAALQQLYLLGAAVTTVDIYGRGIIHYTATYYGLHQLQALRTMDLRGIDPDRQHLGSSVVQDFENRMLRPWLNTQSRPTRAEVFTFYALVTEIRQRNWEAGLFLSTKAALEAEGGIEQLRRWLGCQWLKVHDDDDFAQGTWDPDLDKSPDQYVPEDDSTDYGTGTLYGEGYECETTAGDGFVQAPAGTDEFEDSDAEEEFFDALQ